MRVGGLAGWVAGAFLAGVEVFLAGVLVFDLVGEGAAPPPSAGIASAESATPSAARPAPSTVSDFSGRRSTAKGRVWASAAIRDWMVTAANAG